MPGQCYFCSGQVVHANNGGNGISCPRCDTWAHVPCVEGTSYWEETSGGLLSSGSVKTECPNCGNIEKL